MPNLLDTRRRIRSVKNTQQITQAIKMVSAAKLRRAQEQALAARPYAQRLGTLMGELAGQVDPQDLADARVPGTELPLSELLARRPVKKRLLIAVSTDSGLVGAFNANVTRAALAAAESSEIATAWLPVGRKVRDYARRRGFALAGEHVGVFGRSVDYAIAQAIALAVMQAYARHEVDEVTLIGNEFKSVIQQKVVTRALLPFEAPEAKAATRDYLFESAPGELFAALLPRYLEAQIYRSLLESFASEHAARMNAMEAATTNAGDLIDSLTLNMNRVRQAAITKEIIEVVSGAAALG